MTSTWMPGPKLYQQAPNHHVTCDLFDLDTSPVTLLSISDSHMTILGTSGSGEGSAQPPSPF